MSAVEHSGRLEGKVCLITGGADGIGRATAIEMGRQGARGVVVADLDELVKQSDVVLSIVPPSVAGAVADQVAAAVRATGTDLLYADCNAVAPSASVEAILTIRAHLD